jgi:hypothetical protein
MPAAAQDEGGRVQIGPLGVTPRVQISNAGVDTNVFNQAEDPKRDVRVTASPSLDATLRLRRLRASGRGGLDFVYFNELSHLRSLDTDASGRVSLETGHLTPYVTGSRSNARHRRNVEIDALARRLDEAWGAGIDLRLTGKTSIGVSAMRSRVAYERGAEYLDTDLARVLNREGSGERFRVRYAVTPLTTIGLDAGRERDRFASTPERDADSRRLVAVLELKPFALVSGRAEVGFRKRSFLTRDVPDFRGTTARIGLGHSLLGRTRLSLDAERDLWYSYRLHDAEYLLTSLDLTATHHLVGPWDVRGSLGRSRLAYRGGNSPADAVGDTGSPATALFAGGPVETLFTYSIGIGYRVAGTRLGVEVRRRTRESALSPRRQYQRFTLASSVTYGF